jgi:hypothetical protein
MVALAECLCQQITADGLPDVCFCGVLPGADVAFDYCAPCDEVGHCGQAWVRLVEMFPSKVFPVPDAEGNCSSLLAFQLAVGIVRCAPVPDDDGTPPSMEDQFDTTGLVMADAMAIRRAILCCATANRNRDYLLGPYLPVGPEGGCVGGAWTVFFSE